MPTNLTVSLTKMTFTKKIREKKNKNPEFANLNRKNEIMKLFDWMALNFPNRTKSPLRFIKRNK